MLNMFVPVSDFDPVEHNTAKLFIIDYWNIYLDILQIKAARYVLLHNYYELQYVLMVYPPLSSYYLAMSIKKALVLQKVCISKGLFTQRFIILNVKYINRFYHFEDSYFPKNHKRLYVIFEFMNLLNKETISFLEP